MLKKFLLPLAAASLGGCASAPLQKPEELAAPKQLSCIHLKEAISGSAKYGLVNIVWESRLERGPYISEKEDAEGTYFRGPQGAVRFDRPDQPAKDTFSHTVSDGGIFVPKDPNAAPRLYVYTSLQNTAPQVPAPGVDCSSVVAVKDPVTNKVSVAAAAAAGGLGGTAGRAVAQGAQFSYGQAAVGGAVAGAIVAAFINMDLGKISPGMEVKDPALQAKLRELGRQQVSLQASGATPAGAATAGGSPR